MFIVTSMVTSADVTCLIAVTIFNNNNLSDCYLIIVVCIV